tara:strand:+ start:2159 stop:2674 length:516 start_codon:yes stop_codon:yes gene_type:complete
MSFGNLLNINPTAGPPNPTNQPSVVSAPQLQGLLQNSPAMNNPLYSQQQQFQAQYSPLIEMASRPEMQANMYMPGRSMVGGQFGEGGALSAQQQLMRNQAAMQGTDAYQKMINQNLQHAMTTEQTASQADMAARTQNALLAASALQPATAGTMAGFNTGLQSLMQTTPFKV